MDQNRPQRKMILTEADVAAVVAAIDKQKTLHVCRYDIEPERMERLIRFVDALYEGTVEARKTFKTIVIKLVIRGMLIGFLGLLAYRFGWLKFLTRLLGGNGP